MSSLTTSQEKLFLTRRYIFIIIK